MTYHGDMELLRRTLKSLLRSVRTAQQVQDLDVHVQIISNDLLDEWRKGVRRLAAEFATALPPRIRLEVTASPGNVGFSAGHNRAINAVRSDYHLVLNPDVVLEAPCIRESLSYLAARPCAVMCVPQGYDSEGNYARLAKRSPSVVVLLLRALGRKPGTRLADRRVAQYTYADVLPATEPVAVEHASGCFMLCRTAALRAVGGFDERFFMYFEDYDLSRRIHQFGDIYELPQARICHYGGRTAQQGWQRILRFLRSGITFFQQYGWRLL